MEWWMIAVVFFAIVCVWAAISGYRGKDKFIKQSKHRRQIIRKLHSEGKDWEHIALVLGISGFKNESGEDFEPKQVEAEFDAIDLLNIDVTDIKHK